MKSKIFLAHAALRLTCNHEGYAPLWREQLGVDTWREPIPMHTWPVLASDDDRWTVRAAIDAVVADAYGLTRDQYQHVLSTFSHKSYPKAPERCLAAFDQLKTLGLEAFTRQHDPYHDIPLNEGLPQPVIDLPALASEPAAAPASDVTPITAARSRRTPAPPPAQGTLDLPLAAEPRPPYGAPPKRPRRPRT